MEFEFSCVAIFFVPSFKSRRSFSCLFLSLSLIWVLINFKPAEILLDRKLLREHKVVFFCPAAAAQQHRLLLTKLGNLMLLLG